MAPTERTTDHHLIVCTTCSRTGGDCKPGLALIDALQGPARACSAALLADFRVAGTVCMSGCSHPCTVAFVADGKTSYLFGDIDPGADVDALLEFAALYRAREDGATRWGERPDAIRRKILGRIPCALTVAEAGTAKLS
jgi:predicted metal-binding protein